MGERRKSKTSNSNPSTGSTSQSHWHNHWESLATTRSTRAVWAGRILFVTVLVAVASVLGFVTFRLLTNAEEKLAETQFDSIADRALVEAEQIAQHRRWGGVTMASMVSELYPDANQWPFIEFPGFERIAQDLLNATSGIDTGLIPHITPEQVPEFEEFTYRTYAKLGFPNNTGTSAFGRGIWAQDPAVEGKDKRYHDVSGNTTYGSPYDILTPVYRADERLHPVLMFNVHSNKVQGLVIDRMISCSKERDETTTDIQCGVVSELFRNVKHDERWGVAFRQPIYPANDPVKLVGHVPTLLLLNELLENVFPDKVRGIDAVFETPSQVITFTIIDGEARLVGEGDHSDTEYEKHRKAIELVSSKDSLGLRIALSPNDAFYNVYETKNPTIATMGSVCIIILTSIAFFLYDFFVRREFHAKRELIEARRKFMRFVSHEVRTPLNSVYMGLELMQGQLARALGYESITCARLSSESSGEKNDDAGQKEHHSSGQCTEKQNKEIATRQNIIGWFQLAEEIQVSAQSAVDILNDLLNYDKIEQGTLQLGLEVVDIWQLVENASMEFKLPASSKKIELGLSFSCKHETSNLECCVSRSSELPDFVRRLKVIGDPVRLTQVMRNLISNALKFTPELGSIQVKVEFIAGARGKQGPEDVVLSDDKTITATSKGHVAVTVEDTGAGMTSDQLAHLFRDGVQFNVNELQAGQGSGLGLFIAKGMVSQHHGSLSASSDGLGEGTTFLMTLPLWEEPESGSFDSKKHDLDHVRSSLRSAASGEVNRLRVLVVDDVLSNRKLLCRLLENEGHECDEAKDGLEAVEKVKLADPPYDSVLMDYEMPGMDGPSAAKGIRDFGSPVCIIGITGNCLPEDITYFRACGADDVLSKPVRVSELDSLWMEYGVYSFDCGLGKPSLSSI